MTEQGYAPYFVYGGRGYFDNMNAFFAGNGYAIVDQTSTPADEITFTNAWGMADEDIYRQANAIAAAHHAAGQPFFLHLMTTSNHRPFTYPAGRIEMSSGSGRQGAVRYTDWAIQQFIESARGAPWFADTVFVILGDHCASSAGKVDLPAARYHIPLLIYSPQHIKPRSVTTLASQIDVAPTLLALLNLDYDTMFFGHDMLRAAPAAGRALIGNYQHLGLIADDQVTVLSPRRLHSHHAVREGALTRSTAAQDDALLARTIAYYQGASYVYRHGLNAWHPSPGAHGMTLSAASP